MNGLLTDGAPGPADAGAVKPLPEYPSEELAQRDAGDLLTLLVRDEDRAPYDLIEACAARGEAMVEALHRAVDAGRAWADPHEEGDWWLMLHAAMILGRIPSASAGLELVRLMQRYDFEDDLNLQDWIAGDWPALFANKPAAAIDAARALAEDRDLDWYIRSQALEVAVAAGARDGPEALERALDWVAALAGDAAGAWDMRTAAACALLDFPRERHLGLLRSIGAEEARRASPDEPFHLATLAMDDIHEAFARGRDAPGWKLRDEPWRFYRPDAIAERQARWAREDAEGWDELEDAYFDLPTPYVRETPKVGRNDPCPCGSGKKYKKCCLTKE